MALRVPALPKNGRRFQEGECLNAPVLLPFSKDDGTRQSYHSRRWNSMPLHPQRQKIWEGGVSWPWQRGGIVKFLHAGKRAQKIRRVLPAGRKK
ncbi:hypothetical protein ABGM91_04345 [Akkermansia muciniphila]|uniref:hypothetical protein n=1 Tax=Akkermansia muciniphila TaxID=239935 RepID=UPI0033B9A0DB